MPSGPNTPPHPGPLLPGGEERENRQRRLRPPSAFGGGGQGEVGVVRVNVTWLDWIVRYRRRVGAEPGGNLGMGQSGGSAASLR